MKKFSVSLVYQKQKLIHNGTEVETHLAVLITDAVSPEEALGKAITNYEKDMQGMQLGCKVVLEIKLKSAQTSVAKA